jgi:hypothetical protein
MEPGSGKNFNCPLESRALCFNHGRVQNLGFGKVAENSLQVDYRRRGNPGGERGKLRQRYAEARHARIDLEVQPDLARDSESCGSALDGFNVFGGGNGRSKIVAQHRFLFTAPEAGHYEKGQPHACLADGSTLFRGGHAKPYGSSRFESAGAFNHAVPVGIALDDAARGYAGTEMADDGMVVFAQRGE